MLSRALTLGSILIVGCASTSQHGTLSTLSASTASAMCKHRVPAEVCTRCNESLVTRFKAANDWCGEHSVPESQCFDCHPDLSFEPLPDLRAGADLRRLSEAGEDVPSLDVHAVAGKVTVFDFYADWCSPCRKVDLHLYRILNARDDLAVRKLNVSSWDSALAKRHLSAVPSLPYFVVFGPDRRLRTTLAGFDLPALDRAIAEAAK